jgi:hypothetical protein
LCCCPAGPATECARGPGRPAAGRAAGYPFPEDLTPSIPAAAYAADPRAVAIADAAKRLNELREAWLNPPDLVRRVPEVVPGYPDRLLPKDDAAAAELARRTLTKLYNERPTWLANAHRDLDEAVAAAYGWPADLSDDEILRRLFELNQERATGQATSVTLTQHPSQVTADERAHAASE